MHTTMTVLMDGRNLEVLNPFIFIKLVKCFLNLLAYHRDILTKDHGGDCVPVSECALFPTSQCCWYTRSFTSQCYKIDWWSYQWDIIVIHLLV